MPSDGQQIYGAQHPPSIKLIKELKSSAASTSLGSSSAGAAAAATTNISSSTSSFMDYEKKTCDVWDIDDEILNYNRNDFGDYSFPISITDSEEVAKKIIKNHKESQEKLASPTTKQSNLFNKQPGTGGPGKALRQEQFSIENSNFSSLNLNDNSKKPKEKSNSFQSLPKNFSNQSKLHSSSNQQAASAVLKSSVGKTSQTNSIGGVTSIISNNSNESNQFKYSSYLINRDTDDDLVKCDKFKNIINTNPINLDELQKASWKGIPKSFRPVCWKLLSDYLPLKHELQEKTIEQKRNSYWESVNEYYSSDYVDSHQENLSQILNDIPRMNPLIPIFHKKTVQDIFQRILYVWSVRHPASGYVQGINDLLTPFFSVFLTEYTDTNTEIQSVDIENLPEKSLRQLEADSYWCMTKLLERIQENYVFSQPGIQRNVQSLDDLIKRIDLKLHQHLKKNNIEFIQFAFRWMNNLLMREIPLNCTIRLWDTYHAEPFGFSDFHLYVCAAFLLRFSKNLIEEKDFQGLMILLQNLPTRNLKANDISLLTAEAYKLQVMFANSPNHTATTH